MGQETGYSQYRGDYMHAHHGLSSALYLRRKGVHDWIRAVQSPWRSGRPFVCPGRPSSPAPCLTVRAGAHGAGYRSSDSDCRRQSTRNQPGHPGVFGFPSAPPKGGTSGTPSPSKSLGTFRPGRLPDDRMGKSGMPSPSISPGTLLIRPIDE